MDDVMIIGKPNYTSIEFANDWRGDFIGRIRSETNSRKQNFTFADAVKRSIGIRTKLDEVMINFFQFIDSEPLRKNDYYKFVNSYKNGKKLNEKFFRHSITKLHEYYRKIDENPQYNPFSERNFNRYVLFMLLKLNGCYIDSYDEMFNVKYVGSREYNPLTSIPSVLRAELPVKIKEYDISRAYPTFIFDEIGMEPFDVYAKIDKKKFNTYLNTHKGVEGANIKSVRAKLETIYGSRVSEVITENRFNTKGLLFEEMAKHEKDYIQLFVEANHLQNFVRLHDGIVVTDYTLCEVVEFGNVKFKIKEFISPEVVNQTINFYDDEGNTLASTYCKFFEQEGFLRITMPTNDQVTILKNENKILEPVNHKTDIVSFLQENINELDETYLQNVIAREANTIIQQSFLLLKPVPLTYHRDTKNHSDFPFANGVVRVSTDKIELISYDEIDGFFPKHSIQKHKIKINSVAENPSDFGKFLMLAVGGENGDKDAIKATLTMFGYLLSNYKNPSENPAIILSDEGADGEVRNGGRGKSLLQRAISFFRPTIVKGGNSYDPNYTHVHADLKMEHDIYVIDDVPRNFNYNALYTNITGAIDCQRKGAPAESIPFEYAPKFVISTNWAVRYDRDATSTNRRFREYKFTNFWNIKNTPADYFGKSLFDDWNDAEWNAFFNFGLYCVQLYMNEGLSSIEYDKSGDNFQAYFSNDGTLEEMERIMEILENRDSFSVNDFLQVHTLNDLYKYKPEFHKNNVKDSVNAFIEFRKLSISYDKKWRRWRR